MLSDEQVEAAIRALSDPDRFRDAERLVSEAAPQLQNILTHALNEGGWFGPAHQSEVRAAAAEPDETTRATRIETLLAEETRMGMLVGVAVGWQLANELGTTIETEGD
jgi:hypothetical protein